MKKATRPEEQSSPRKANTITTRPVLSPREARLLSALLRSHDGLSREDCDRLTPCSNSPHYIQQVRQKLRLQIPCRRVEFVTKDGEQSWYGHYYLTGTDRTMLARAEQ